MSEEAGRGNHGSCHSITCKSARSPGRLTNKDDGVLCLSRFGKGQDFPARFGDHAIIVCEKDIVLARVVELNIAVRLCEDVDGDFGSSSLAKKVLVVGKVVFFD